MRAWPALTAVVAWLLGLLLAFWLPPLVDLDPFTVEATALPVAVLLPLAGVCLGLWVWTRRDSVVGLVAGIAAGGVALGLTSMLHGTPYSPGGLVGDVGRFTALATRYTVTTASADGIIKGAPSEYPPLVPWLVGKAAVVLDVPAWQLLTPMVVVLTSGSVIVAFWLWTRIVPVALALVLAVLPLVVFSNPAKSFHLLSLSVLAPWVLVSFTGRSRDQGGLHWFWAGIVGALVVLVYPGYLVFVGFGVVATIGWVWWHSTYRWAYVRHLVGIAAVAAVATSWYVVPFLLAQRSFATGSVSDQFDSLSNYFDPSHLLPTVLVGNPLLLGLWLLGAVSLAWYAGRRRPWALAIAALVVGAYLYRTLRLVKYVADGSTGFLQYTNRIIDVLLVSAGALGLAAALSALSRRTGRPVPVAVPATLVVLATGLGVFGYLDANRLPIATTTGSVQTLQAHIEPLPDCTLPRFAPTPVEPSAVAAAPGPQRTGSLAFQPVPCFPAAAVRTAVEAELGEWALPITVSYSERLWAFYPWYGYLTIDRTAAGLFQNYDARVAALAAVSDLATSDEVAAALATTAFGPIDVLVLRRSGDGLVWSAGGPTPRTIRFRRDQFHGAPFAVVDVSPTTTVVIRRGADVEHVPYPV